MGTAPALIAWGDTLLVTSFCHEAHTLVTLEVSPQLPRPIPHIQALMSSEAHQR